MTEPVVDVVKRELRRLSPGIKVTEDEIRALLQSELIKREVFEGEKAQQAQKQVAKAEKRSLRQTREGSTDDGLANDLVQDTGQESGQV